MFFSRLLPWQIVEPVLWQKTMKEIYLLNFEQTFYEVGPGRQLAAVLAKPISLPRHT